MSLTNRREFLKASGAFLVSAVGGAGCITGKSRARGRPNFLVIVADDLGYADMSFLDSSPVDVNTPAIDSLAKTGTYFTNAYATAAICSPARAGLITGRYQQRWGNYWYNEGGLPAEELTIPQAMKKLGYATKKIGKTHLNGGPVEHPLDHGFDEFLGFIHHTWDYMRLSEKDVEAYGAEHARKASIGPLIRGREKVSYEGGFTTDIFTDEAIEFIERDKGSRPFYIELEYNAVHHPTYVGHPDYLERFGIEQFRFWDAQKEPWEKWHGKWGWLNEVDPDGRRRYLSQLAVLDDGIKKILNKLDETGQRENTVIVFLSDNGGTINTFSDNTPLRGYKFMMAEGGIRIPLIISWPGKIDGAKKCDGIVSAMDILPTMLEIGGGEVPANLDGRSLLPLLKGQRQNNHETLCFSNGRDKWVVRKGNWKLCHNAGWKHKGFEIVDGKCVRGSKGFEFPDGILLFNLKDDIGETKDLAAEYPDMVEDLTAVYNNWRKEMGEPISLPTGY